MSICDKCKDEKSYSTAVELCGGFSVSICASCRSDWSKYCHQLMSDLHRQELIVAYFIRNGLYDKMLEAVQLLTTIRTTLFHLGVAWVATPK